MERKLEINKLIDLGYKCISIEAPSNIALIKYWGKKLGQIPMNPSVSYTLNSCKTTFSLYYKKTDVSYENEFYFDGVFAPEFAAKTFKLIETISSDFSELGKYHLILNSTNSFPHSSGIASSASSMCALSSCLLNLLGKSDDLNLISHYARLGSGSAARSVFGGVVTWGASSLVENSSDLFATKLNEEIHSDMKNICDTIVIIHDGVKEVSSTMGHSLMENHPFRDVRILNANNRFKELIEAMKLGDFSSWGKIIEAEALELHAMMMTSNPSYILLKPKTLDVLETVRNIRKEHSVDLYFTLDAGPNVHLLYPEKQKSQVLKLIKENITGLKLINDKTGPGPRVLKC